MHYFQLYLNEKFINIHITNQIKNKLLISIFSSNLKGLQIFKIIYSFEYGLY